MKKIRFGIVGTGNIAHRFAQAIANVPQAELAAVASRTQESAHVFAEEFRIPARFGSYEAMAASDCMDAAYIAVPHALHKSCSMLMMEHGKHVLCEKPMAVNAREAEEMFACSQKNQVFLMEAMWARLVPGTVYLLQQIADGLLGEIRAVEGKFCYTLDADEMEHHVLKAENGGGSLLDVGIYGLSFASWYLGKSVRSIQSAAELYRGVDSHTCMLLQFENGAIADLSSAVLLRKSNEGYIYGTKGYVRLERFYAPQNIEVHPLSGEPYTISVPYRGNGFEEQIAHVCDCIAQGMKQSPVITPEQTLYIAKQMDTIRRQIGVVYPQDKGNI